MRLLDRKPACAALALVLLLGCDSASGEDAGLLDAGPRPDASHGDAGRDEPDAATSDAGFGLLGLGDSCALGAECVSGECVTGVCCERACDGACEACAAAATARPDGECAPVDDARVCRPRDGLCDVEERCDGSSSACPADGFASDGVPCRQAMDLCDVEELCDGLTSVCPPDAVASAGLECRAASGGCDVAEVCDGLHLECPPQPAPLSAQVSFVDVRCHGGADGSATAMGVDGVPPYSYRWSNGETTASIRGISGGLYGVEVSDANGCSVMRSVFLFEPDAIGASFTVDDGTCGGDDGAVQASVSGGTPIYAYAWSTGATTRDLSGVAPGTYDLTVTDLNGCSGSFSASVGDPCSVVPRTVFVSSASFPSTFGGLSDADARCQSLAQAANLTGTYRAWLSDSTVSARDRLTHSSVPYARVDGVRIADDWADLVDGSLAAPIQVDENGVTLAATAAAWTATSHTGQAFLSGSGSCDDWAFAPGGDSYVGRVASVTSGWSLQQSIGCAGRLRRLYCFEQ